MYNFIMKKLQLSLIGIPIVATIMLTIACSNPADKKDEIIDPKPEINNFWNKLVDETHQDIDVKGNNQEEWLKIKTFYEQALIQLETKDINFWKWVKTQKHLSSREDVYDLKQPNYKVYLSWYKQILAWVNFNLFCLEGDFSFAKMMTSENKDEVIKFYEQSPKLSAANNEFNLNFTYWSSYMTNQDQLKKTNNPWTAVEKTNWFKVANHLNNQQKIQSEQFKALNWYMQTKGWWK